MSQVKLLHAINSMHGWAQGNKLYLDIAFALDIKQDSLLKLLLDNFLCHPDGKVADGIGEEEAVHAILLALILTERHHRTKKPR